MLLPAANRSSEIDLPGQTGVSIERRG